jgi:hypothetical protein
MDLFDSLQQQQQIFTELLQPQKNTLAVDQSRHSVNNKNLWGVHDMLTNGQGLSMQFPADSGSAAGGGKSPPSESQGGVRMQNAGGLFMNM